MMFILLPASSGLCIYCSITSFYYVEDNIANIVLTVPVESGKACSSMIQYISSSIFTTGITVIVKLQYIPRNMHTVLALLCFVVVIHWLIFPYPSGLLHWHCVNLTIASVPAKQPWWIWINTSCEFIMNDCITTTKQSTTKPCAYFLGYTVTQLSPRVCRNLIVGFIRLAKIRPMISLCAVS